MDRESVLKSLVPIRAICTRLPRKDFEDSSLVWWVPVTELGTPVRIPTINLEKGQWAEDSAWVVDFRIKTLGSSSYHNYPVIPAPTIPELLSKLPDVTIEWLWEEGSCLVTIQGDETIYSDGYLVNALARAYIDWKKEGGIYN